MLKYAHVQPVITPRFAISCTMPLMTRLAELSRKYNLNIQVKYYVVDVTIRIHFILLFRRTFLKIRLNVKKVS